MIKIYIYIHYINMTGIRCFHVINSHVRCPWIVPQCGISWWRVLRWDQWVSHGLTLWCEDSIGFYRIPMDSNGFQWIFHGFSIVLFLVLETWKGKEQDGKRRISACDGMCILKIRAPQCFGYDHIIHPNQSRKRCQSCHSSPVENGVECRCWVSSRKHLNCRHS